MAQTHDTDTQSIHDQSPVPATNTGASLPAPVGALGARSAPQKEEELGPLKVGEGQLTFDAEGNDDETSRYFTRTIHYPPIGNSGVTLGRGYDMGSRSAEEIRKHLEAAGVESGKIALLTQAAGKKKKAAGDYVREYKARVGTITHKQQKILFQIVYGELKKDVIRITTKQDVEKKYGKTDLDSLHPSIMELVVDLRYRGDYHSESRKRVQPLMVKNDLQGLATLMANEGYWVDKFNVPKDRFNRRKKYMQDAVAGKMPTPISTDAQSEVKQPLSSPTSTGTVTAVPSLNVRSGPGTGNDKLASLPTGTKVDIYKTQGDWLQIGEGRWVFGKYVNKQAVKMGSGTVSPNRLNVRSGPGTTFNKIEALSKGSSVDIYEKKGVWARIGEGKWVHSGYLNTTSVQPEQSSSENKSNSEVEKSPKSAGAMLDGFWDWLSESYDQNEKWVKDQVSAISEWWNSSDETEEPAKVEKEKDQAPEPVAPNPVVSSTKWNVSDGKSYLRDSSGALIKTNDGKNKIVPVGTKVVINEDKQFNGKTMVKISNAVDNSLIGWTMYSNLSVSFVGDNFWQSQDPNAPAQKAETAGWTKCRFVASEMVEEYLAGTNPAMKTQLGINNNGDNMTTGAGQFLRILYEDKAQKPNTIEGKKNYKKDEWLMPHAQKDEAFAYIDSYLNQNVPVLVGVDHTFNRILSGHKGSSKSGYGYNEGTTDHFITLTGVGVDVETGKKFYSYLDPGRTYKKDGANAGSNKLVETSPGRFEDKSAGSGYGQHYHLSIVVLFPSDRAKYSKTIEENKLAKKKASRV